MTNLIASKNLLIAVLACVLGSGFQHGYSGGVVNNPQAILMKFINTTQYERTGEGFSESSLTIIWSVAVSIYCLGGMAGALMVAFVADKYGRKRGLLLNNIFVLLSAISFGFAKLAKSFEMFIIGRLLIGINSGLNAGLAPMYITEISPTESRGALGSTYQLVITVSILISQVLGLPSVLGSETYWPLLFAIIILPGLLQVVLLLMSPESPKFCLLEAKRKDEAYEALKWLRQRDDVQAELQELQAEADSMLNVQQPSYKDFFLRSNLRMPLIIAIVMMLGQQLSGINAVIFFSSDIFRSAGLEEQAAFNATLGMGAINIAVTVVSIWLVERLGRRPLLTGGLGGLLVVLLLLTLCMALRELAPWLQYISIVLVFLFIIIFATGLGSIPWFLVTEIFDQQYRGRATSIAVCVNWGANFVVAVGFLPLKQAMDHWVFLIFAACVLACLVFSILKVPETKGCTVEEIQSQLSGMNGAMKNTVSKQELTTAVSVETVVDQPS